MTVNVYTESVVAFANSCDGGVPALAAVIEKEVESLLEDGLDKIPDLIFHIFSWNGINNLIMSPLANDLLLIDMNDDDGQEPIHIENDPCPPQDQSVPYPFT